MIYERIKRLCDMEGISIRRLEIECGLGNGCIGGWRKKTPRIASIKKVAEYFRLPVDYFV